MLFPGLKNVDVSGCKNTSDLIEIYGKVTLRLDFWFFWLANEFSAKLLGSVRPTQWRLPMWVFKTGIQISVNNILVPGSIFHTVYDYNTIVAFAASVLGFQLSTFLETTRFQTSNKQSCLIRHRVLKSSAMAFHDCTITFITAVSLQCWLVIRVLFWGRHKCCKLFLLSKSTNPPVKCWLYKLEVHST